jgi:hypothetical protein
MNYYNTEKRNRSLPEKTTAAITIIICPVCWGISYFYAKDFPINSVSEILINKGIVYMIGLLAMITAGFLIQRINDHEMFLKERTRLPLMLFLLFFSTNAVLLPVSNATIVIFCLVALLHELFKSYQKPEATVDFYNAGAYMGIASFFVPQMLFFVPAIWAGMYNFRALELKSFLASFTGIMTTGWIMLAWCVWKNDFSVYANWWNDLVYINFFPIESMLQYQRLALIGILILATVSCFYVKTGSFTNIVRMRTMLSFLVNITVLAVFLTFLYSDKADIFQAIIYLTGAVLIAYFSEAVKHWIKIALFYFMLAVLLFSFIASVWNF